MLLIDTRNQDGVEPAGHFGGLTTIDVVGPVNARHMAIQLSRGPRGSGAFMHAHEESEQLFFVLSGKLLMRNADGESVTLEPGMAVYLAPNEAHATANEGEEDVISLVITAPQLR